ncbi:glycosyltransferase family 4 protein [Agaribacterium haliotis]|uniref:glycosyltransferase family 4 protein n=1 Tax=Agaribacterium haliotis TaxID=2013869 RepID=UPI001EFC8306|nr:glycosyltransferase family 4 protein [Agaribacterium haliotis]
MSKSQKPRIEVIIGNSNKRFSGVSSTMLQTLEYQRHETDIAVLGKAHLDGELSELGYSFNSLRKALKQPLEHGRFRVFHARRNDEMIQALILKHICRVKMRILFTSTAQRYHSRFSRWLMSKMDCVISTCAAAGKYLNPPPAKLIAHGIRTDIYRPATQRSNKSIQIAMFGRVRKQKGSDLFVKACLAVLPRFPNCKALIVGAISPENQSLVDQLRQRIKQAGLEQRIEFTGELDFNQLPELFRQSHLVAALSHTEGFGLTVLEAMSSGAAVLATEAGAWPEIIEQGVQGWVVPTGAQQAINEKLELMLSDTDKLISMGLAGRERVLKCYRIEHEAEQLCELYRAMQAADFNSAKLN